MAGRTLASSLRFTVAILTLLFNVYLRGVEGATFLIKNQCRYTVWAAGIPVGGGKKLTSGQSWNVNVPAGTAAGRFWGRTECSFDATGRGNCKTGDCGGALNCKLSGQAPTTLAEYTLNGGNNKDYYDLSVIDGFNVPMSMTPSVSGCIKPICKTKSCSDAYRYPTDDTKTHGCTSGGNFNIAFCP